MKSIIKIMLISFLMLVAQVCCTNDLQESDLKLNPNPRVAKIPESSSEQLKKLNLMAPENSKSGKFVKDLRLILEAEILEEKKVFHKAAEKYFNALEVAEGRFAKHALKKWIETYAISLDQKTKPAFVARLLNDISQSGKLSPYLRHRGLTSADALKPKVIKYASDYLLPDSDEKDIFPKAPKSKGVPKGDPLLTETNKTYCQGRGKPGYQWKAWVNNLDNMTKKYWDSLILICQGNQHKAFKKLQSLIPKLRAKKKTRNFAVYAGKKMVKYYRYNAAREKAADGYSQLVESWKKSGVNYKTMNMKADEFELEKINDHLWAGRYRALVGDYENGKIFTNRALKLIEIAHTKRSLQSANFKKELGLYKAEAYIILANRIALEKKDVESAISLMLIAQEIPQLEQKMYERVLWYGGLYNYINKSYQKSINLWSKMIKDTEDDSTKARGYFWLARTHKKLDQRGQVSKYVHLLSSNYQHSYYNVVAMNQSGLDRDKTWKKGIGRFDTLANLLKEKRKFKLSKAKKNKSLYNKIKKAEILTVGRFGDWAKKSVLDLEPQFKKVFDMKKDTSAYVYLTRLHFSAENYLHGIVLTTKLRDEIENFWVEWPDQLLIYFPRPYDNIYSRNALETSLEKNLLLSISRQESAFNPSAASSAGAHGLMQLIMPTANRVAERIGIPTEGLKKELGQPEVNIKLGSNYLKMLKLRYPNFKPAVYGAYNAGEYAVDNWLERRGHKDPLVWIELVPFGETRGYIKNVWRNRLVYKHLQNTEKYSYNNRLRISAHKIVIDNIKQQARYH